MEVSLKLPAGKPFVTAAVRTPFVAAAFKPRKNANFVGSVGAVWVIESICSITTCEWPWITPCVFSCCGAEK